jgi:hypothetical protein
VAKDPGGGIKREVVLRSAHGLCQCTGECGHNHQWQASQPPVRCRAPFEQNIRRKKDHPSCWRLASSHTGTLEHAEYFNDKDIEVKVNIVEKRGDKGIEHLAFCERCAKCAGEKNAVRVVPE